MILWVMPDSGARTKEDYQLLVQRFKQEYPQAEITVEVFTRHKAPHSKSNFTL